MSFHRTELVLQSTKKTKAFGLASHYKKMCNKRPQSHCVTAKECWHGQDYSRQGPCSFIFCSYFLVPCSSFFHLYYFLSSCFSCSFSPVILLLCIVCLPSLFLTVVLLHLLGWGCLPFFSISLPYVSLSRKPLTSMWTEGPQKTPAKFNRAHLGVQKVWNGSILGVGASWLMQIRSDDISSRLGWMVWAPPPSICRYFTKHLCPFSSVRYRAISKAGTASSHACL